MGIAKIPFAEDGAVALHGGVEPLLLGKPVSLGCVRMTDRDLRSLLDWLEQRGAFTRARSGSRADTGEEEVQHFHRSVVLHVR
jgi:hypothetical protein